MNENLNITENWEFNVLNIDNYKSKGKFRTYYDFLKKNHNKLNGDILEAGVFQGKSLIATAILLKELGSKKKIYGFDSFIGFNKRANKNDKFDNFLKLYNEKQITRKHLEKHQKLIYLKKLLQNKDYDTFNISSSNSFENNSLSDLKKKIDKLKLDNIVLVKGDFRKTMNNHKFKKLKLMAAMIDCDLYESYKYTLNFIWERLTKGSLIYLDEYYSLKFPGARIACNEFFINKKQKPVMIEKKVNDFERWAVFK